jgi:hypothetical protein
VQRDVREAPAALAQCDEALVREQLAGQAVAVKVDVQRGQALAVHRERARHVVRHAAHAARALVDGQVAQRGAQRGERVRAQALRVRQRLVALVARGEALHALGGARLLRPVL